MPTCALQPSQCSQFEGSQPLSQHAMSEQHSQASFGGGAPIAAHLSERSYTDSQEGANASVHLEAQVSPLARPGEGEAGSDNTRQPILEVRPAPPWRATRCQLRSPVSVPVRLAQFALSASAAPGGPGP
jgi:hypothetical protein